MNHSTIHSRGSSILADEKDVLPEPRPLGSTARKRNAVTSTSLNAHTPPQLEPITHSKLNLNTPSTRKSKGKSKSIEEHSQSPRRVARSFESRSDVTHTSTKKHRSLRSPGPVRKGYNKIRKPIALDTLELDRKGPALPDRFIPRRENSITPSTPFRVGKSARELSPEERLLRQRLPKEDPFLPTRSGRPINTPRIPSDRICSTHYGPHLVIDPAVPSNDFARGSRDFSRQVSNGAVWNVGGTSAALGRRSMATPNGSGGQIATGTTAPMFAARFLPHVASTEEREKHKSRVALALDIDPARRLLKNCKPWPLLESLPSPSSPDFEKYSPFVWKDNAWRRAEKYQWIVAKEGERVVPNRPFRILDAPLLRDDFYCSTLAYSSISGILAVGLGHRVYLWSEHLGVQHPPLSDQHPSNYVTSLAFSSENGGKSILAVGRQSGMLSLWSTFDSDVRFEISHPDSITCLAFRPTKSRRLSERLRHLEVDVEELAVGDDLGNIWYYSVEWPDSEEWDEYDFNGSMTLIAKISAHTQQICGITWSPEGSYLATGGNDNCCLLFDLHNILPPREHKPSSPGRTPHQSRQSEGTECTGTFTCFAASASKQLFRRRSLISHLLPPWAFSSAKPLYSSLLNHTGSLISGGDRTVLVPSNRQRHRLVHGAAVKAIAFAPWQPSLLATGGGSNDRAIHFYHAPTGACLATINVYAQVTSLIWSRTRREIVATFGFAQPEHPFRIAVFAWPSCEQIAAIPWGPHGSSWDSPESDMIDCGRALCAVSYPGRPRNCEDHRSDQESRSSTSMVMHDRLAEPSRSEPSRRSTVREVVRPRAKEGGLWCSRTVQEGCIIVASSDQSVKFHEVWSGPKRGAAVVAGPLGGSGILEGLEGLEILGDEIIR
ncbi:WD40 repeat-like protein [Aspergillus piperis CBS 112811]|uniref:WD40 repeat-like protein n=1 Tax=Aspergillus piperis CBS 112811 TaxID=1448313 RepID=A0A8G1R5G7_9EURO|nr:WD40 repeat-like protein [Aspergillus piperis CBS 112811]RAH58095.1 WD40 repeat-like protein [Aspergillus piperis CBS 112811]